MGVLNLIAESEATPAETLEVKYENHKKTTIENPAYMTWITPD
jgi:hypothetical protein